MYVTPTDIHAKGSTRSAPAYPRPRSGEGPLAEEAIYGRASQAVRRPEAALMCAILDDAVETFKHQFVSRAQRAQRLGEEAGEWLFGDDSLWVFSFLSICAALDLSPQYIRQGLKRWQEREQQPRYKQQARVCASPGEIGPIRPALMTSDRC